MRTVTLEEAQTHLDELVTLVDNGEEVELVRPGKPSLTLIRKKPVRKHKRQAGRYADQKWFMSDDFNDALPDEFCIGEESV